jgi:hypothetical protein
VILTHDAKNLSNEVASLPNESVITQREHAFFGRLPLSRHGRSTVVFGGLGSS